jgi:hypothetical protein
LSLSSAQNEESLKKATPGRFFTGKKTSQGVITSPSFCGGSLYEDT